MSGRQGAFTQSTKYYSPLPHLQNLSLSFQTTCSTCRTYLACKLHSWHQLIRSRRTLKWDPLLRLSPKAPFLSNLQLLCSTAFASLKQSWEHTLFIRSCCWWWWFLSLFSALAQISWRVSASKVAALVVASLSWVERESQLRLSLEPAYIKSLFVLGPTEQWEWHMNCINTPVRG